MAVTSAFVSTGGVGSRDSIMLLISCNLAKGMGLVWLAESQLFTHDTETPQAAASSGRLMPWSLLSHFLISSLVNTQGIIARKGRKTRKNYNFL